jgi:hypothetical protein
MENSMSTATTASQILKAWDETKQQLLPAVLSDTQGNADWIRHYMDKNQLAWTSSNVLQAVKALHAEGRLMWDVEPTSQTKADRDKKAADRQRKEWAAQHKAAMDQGRNVSDGSRFEKGEKIDPNTDSTASEARSRKENLAASEARAKADVVATAAAETQKAEQKAEVNVTSIIAGFTPCGDHGILFRIQSDWQTKMRSYLKNAQAKNIAYVLHDDGSYAQVPFSWIGSSETKTGTRRKRNG